MVYITVEEDVENVKVSSWTARMFRGKPCDMVKEANSRVKNNEYYAKANMTQEVQCCQYYDLTRLDVYEFMSSGLLKMFFFW